MDIRHLFWKLRNPPWLVLWIWIVVLVWCEILTHYWAISRCASRLDFAIKNTRIAVVSDPQLTDVYSYDFMETDGLAAKLTKWFSDIYMRKAYRALQASIQPHAVVFLGDLFDGGRVTEGPAYAEEYERWNWVFEKRLAATQVYNVTGNHDIGLGSYLSEQTVRRYVTHFGSMNFRVTIGTFELIVICAPCLVENVGAPTNETIHFIRQLASEPAETTRVLFTHIPLWRKPGTYCGPLRRAPLLGPGAGVSYQNLVNEADTRWILDAVRPVLVLSGDDHDQCTVRHNARVIEHTAGTFSWLQGNIFPSFLTVSLATPPDDMKMKAMHVEHPSADRTLPFVGETPMRLRSLLEPTAANDLSMSHTDGNVLFDICFLPPQMLLYFLYGGLGVFTVFMLLCLPCFSIYRTLAYSLPLPSTPDWSTRLDYDVESGQFVALSTPPSGPTSDPLAPRRRGPASGRDALGSAGPLAVGVGDRDPTGKREDHGGVRAAAWVAWFYLMPSLRTLLLGFGCFVLIQWLTS